MSGRHNIDDIFKENLKHFEVIPPFGVWGSIHNDLPVPIPFYKKPVVWVGSALMILLLGIGSFLGVQHLPSPLASTDAVLAPEPNVASNLENNSHQFATVSNEGNTLNREYAAVFPENRLNNHQSREQIIEEAVELASFSSESKKGELVVNKIIPVDGQFAESDISLRKALLLNYVNNNFIGFYQSNQNIAASIVERAELTAGGLAMLQNIDAAIDQPLKKVKMPLEAEVAKPDFPTAKSRLNTQGFYVGAFTSLNNTWILNRKALDDADNGKIGYRLDFGHDYGMTVGYNFTPNFGMQFEWIMNSRQGQKFDSFHKNGRLHKDTEINLNYTHFPILFKYRMQKFSGLTNQPFVINYVAGIEYGWLKSAEVNLNNPILQKDLLRKVSWGFVGGIDSEIYITPNYFVTLGIRSSISTSSDSFNQLAFPTRKSTNNLILGLRAGINYRFK